MSAILALVLAACIQGPWDYYPEHPADFRGVFATGYVLSGGPLTQFCFERILNLGEEHTQAFAWYDSADVRVSGPFSGQSRTVVLSAVSDTPNCFKGDPNLLADRGGEYHLDARFAWDSSGSRVLSRIIGTAHVPDSFSIHATAAAPSLATSGGVPDNLLDTAFFRKLSPQVQGPFIAQYGDSLLALRNDSAGLNRFVREHGQAMRDLLLELLRHDQSVYRNGDTLYYLKGSLNTLSHYYSSNHSANVGAVLVTQRFEKNSGRPETLFDAPLGIQPDSDQFYFPGDIRRLILYPNAVGPNGWNMLDSIGIVNTWFLTQRNRLYFYGFEKAYYEFHASATQVQGGGGPSDGDARVKPRYNVEGGAGIFVGGIPDSFDVYIKTDTLTHVYSLPEVRTYACRKKGWGDNPDCREYYPEYCRAQAWQPADCRPDAVRLCLDPAAAKDTSLGSLCDSIGSPVLADTAPGRIAKLLYCVEKAFPSDPVCDGPRADCLETRGRNACKDWFWDYCLDHQWRPLDFCLPALVSYCREQPRLSETLCRNADAWCDAHADSPLCK